MRIRRLVVDYQTGMGVFWSTQPDKFDHRTTYALDRLLHLMPDCVGLPEMLFRPPVLNSRKVRYLPFFEDTFECIHDVLLYGDYGGVGRVVRWNPLGAKLEYEGIDNFILPEDVNNLSIAGSSIIIGTSLPQLYRRRPRKSI